MSPTQVLARLNWERQHVPLGHETLEPANEVVRMRAPNGSHHVIIWSNLTQENADAVIDREVAWHQSLGVSFEWKVYSYDEPADLKERLRSRGFEIGEVESVMVMGIEEDGEEARRDAGEQARRDIGTKARRGEEKLGDVDGCDSSSCGSWPERVDEFQISNFRTDWRVECVRSSGQLGTFKELAEEIFGGDWTFTTDQLRSSIDKNDPTHRGYIGYMNGEPASIGRLYVHPQSWFAGLYGGGTRPEFRGRGMYKAVVEARIRDANEWGAKYAMVDARETSRGILERMGFKRIGETWPCVLGEIG